MNCWKRIRLELRGVSRPTEAWSDSIRTGRFACKNCTEDGQVLSEEYAADGIEVMRDGR